MTKELPRYAQVGLGARGALYNNALLKQYSDKGTLVGVCDINEGRLNDVMAKVKANNGIAKAYLADDFERMIDETKPDTVIVTTVDAFHGQYACKAMEKGCDVITEKPMATDAEKTQRIIDTKAKTGRNVTVTFNYRYSPPRTQMKHLMLSNIIGDVISVDFNWMLDLRHGADYFRRWHRNKKNSGGLLVHKATHHFDLINWWLATVPKKVYATGQRRFYKPETADGYGLTKRTERCLTCPEKEKCKFYLDIENSKNLKSLYLNNENYDAYFRDRCVFSSQIDIEDSVCMAVDYQNGVKMSYSLNAFSPWEGYIVNINGTRGRLEHKCQESVYISGDENIPGALKPEGTWIKIYPQWKDPYSIEVWTGEGGHGGGDPLLLGDIFDKANQPKDKYLRCADQRGGAWSIMTGIAANESLKCGKPVFINDLVQNIGFPDYP
jgi:predicted dehydrogenase